MQLPKKAGREKAKNVAPQNKSLNQFYENTFATKSID